MALTSITFVLFLSLICVVSYAVPSKLRYIWLLLCSYGFYLYDPANWRQNLPAMAFLLIATIVSYGCSLGIQKASSLKVKRVFLVLSLLTCLGLLIACKYAGFFSTGVENLLSLFGVNTSLPRLNWALPLGISYYTLQTVSYAADVYLGNTQAEKNPLRYALYVNFFPGIVTGPINRAGDMLPQYKAPPKFDYNRVSGGFFRILWGLVKKMVIADNIGIFTSAVFGQTVKYEGPVLLLAGLLFAYQIYADFGGCCDIAIGAAKMLGFEFTENFDRPFSAKTFAGLWQRWHISLTSFFRDYVFTPLVWSRWMEKLPFIGKKVQKPPVASSTIIIFTISGLWHGANIYYVIWGLLNGIILAFSKSISKKKERFVSHIPVYKNKHIRGFFQRIFVYLLFAGCLVFFAAALFGSNIMHWFSGLFTGWAGLITHFSSFVSTLGTHGLTIPVLMVLFAGIILVECIEKCGDVSLWIRRRGWFFRWPLYYVLLAVLFAFGAFGQSPFIYQNY